MALKLIEGVVAEAGASTPLLSEAGPAGTSWAFVRFSRGSRSDVTLARVLADVTVGARIAPKQAGRFAFYRHGDQHVLCGFAGPDGTEIVPAASDPAGIAADVIRLPAKRRIFWGTLLIPTLIGIFHGIEMIKAGRRVLREHPAPKRPGDPRITRALKGQLFWPF